MESTDEWFEIGKAEGLILGRLDLLFRILRGRFGADAQTIFASLTEKMAEQLDAFACSLDDFKSTADAKRWLSQHC